MNYILQIPLTRDKLNAKPEMQSLTSNQGYDNVLIDKDYHTFHSSQISPKSPGI
jgi:hypothetical protein